MTNLFLLDKFQTLNGEGFKVLPFSIDVPKILNTFFFKSKPKRSHHDRVTHFDGNKSEDKSQILRPIAWPNRPITHPSNNKGV